MLELIMNILVYVLIGVLLHEVHPNLAYALSVFIAYQYYIAILKQISFKRAMEKVQQEIDKRGK